MRHMQPFTSQSLNLRYLLKKSKIKGLRLHSYLSYKEVSELRHEYLDDTFVHHVVHEDTVGFPEDGSGRPAFVYFKGIMPQKEIAQAERD